MNTPPCTSRNKSSVAGHRKTNQVLSRDLARSRKGWDGSTGSQLGDSLDFSGSTQYILPPLSSRGAGILRKACGMTWKWKVECPETQNHGGEFKTKCWISAESKSVFMSLVWNSVKKKVWKKKCYFPLSPRQHLFPACRGSHVCFGMPPVFPALF